MPKKKPTQAPLLDASVTALDEQQLVILSRLGLESLPTHETRWLPLARIQVRGEEKVRVPTSMVQSIKRFDVLQAPSIVCCSPPEEAEESKLYEVIAGRRRTKGAKLAGLQAIKCEVYAYSTPQLSALLALIENTQRSSAWVKEVADLRLLVDQHVGMTVKELVACGFAQAGLTERLKFAHLPAPLLDQIVSGKVALEVARKLVRLTHDQLARVTQATQNEPLSAELVKEALRVQISSNLSIAQIGFPTWQQVPIVLAAPASLPSSGDHPTSEYLSLGQMVTTLRAFTQSDEYRHVEESHLLVQALIQRLEVATREQGQANYRPLAS